MYLVLVASPKQSTPPTTSSCPSTSPMSPTILFHASLVQMPLPTFDIRGSERVNDEDKRKKERGERRREGGERKDKGIPLLGIENLREDNAWLCDEGIVLNRL